MSDPRATRQQWAAARLAAVRNEREELWYQTGLGPDNNVVPEVLDGLIKWRMNDPRYADRTLMKEGAYMQKQWTIEARADFSDKEKNDMIDLAVKHACAHVYAQLALLSDGQKPSVSCYSDDWFMHEDLDWLGDPLGKAIAENKLSETPEDPASQGVSDELLAAVRDMQRDEKDK